MITIRQNESLDEQTYKDFHNFSLEGADFAEIIRKDHKDLTIVNYKEYIKNYYHSQAIEIKASMEELNRELKIKGPKFFYALEHYFRKDYSGKDYVGFISIFNCNPRFVEDNTFQVYYKKTPNNRLEVCFHEVSHFAFFDFCVENVMQTRGLDTNSGPLWEFSEIFNVILLNQPEFQAVLGEGELLFYPALADKLGFIRTLWVRNEETLSAPFINDGLEYLNKTF